MAYFAFYKRLILFLDIQAVKVKHTWNPNIDEFTTKGAQMGKTYLLNQYTCFYNKIGE